MASGTHHPGVLACGVTVIAAGGLLLAAGLASPWPISIDFIQYQNFFRDWPRTLVAPALAILCFALPSLVFIVVEIALRA